MTTTIDANTQQAIRVYQETITEKDKQIAARDLRIEQLGKLAANLAKEVDRLNAEKK